MDCNEPKNNMKILYAMLNGIESSKRGQYDGDSIKVLIIIVFLHGSFYKVLFISKLFWKCCYEQFKTRKKVLYKCFYCNGWMSEPSPRGPWSNRAFWPTRNCWVQPGRTGNPAGIQPWRTGFHSPVWTHIVSFALSDVLFKTAVRQHHWM